MGSARAKPKPNTARGATHQLDDALFGQSPQVILSGVGRGKAKFGRDLGAGRRRAGAGDGLLDQCQDLPLARRQPGPVKARAGKIVLQAGHRPAPRGEQCCLGEQRCIGLLKDCVNIQ